ncbi:hypothetical protein VA603_03485 [Stenotrophomonas sp. MH1]|uniref:Transmembrane protein n=1 Tax=Stenotrophomonas capsici TaxID=3110230 RepID=A0ABU5V080_9GAMM|nr:hypothetical protein [Stenotrophomonas sp. MH1]MEA5666597.1 hypothetical protein [Stenotrophomonas sp. MH1]
MANAKIVPEKINTPIQLVAAWFAILFLLVSAFLVTAINIDKPTWAPAFLLISSAITTLLVLVFVGLMLTIFRPHLQEGKDYARWLRNKNAYSPGLINQLPTAPVATLTEAIAPHKTEGEKTHNLLININGHVDGWLDIFRSLVEAGFFVEKYTDPSPLQKNGMEKPEHQACIWVGERVSAPAAIKAIKIAINHWPHLKYLELSNDGADPPDEVHDELFIGGATSTALQRNLRPWTVDELSKLPEDISRQQFHSMIRSRYS